MKNKKKLINNDRGNETLCWTCSKCTGGCSWSEDFIPVKGWKATARYVDEMDDAPPWSYRVEECPEYERGGVEINFYNDDALNNLVIKVGERISKDYIAAFKQYVASPAEGFTRLSCERKIVLSGMLTYTDVDTKEFLKNLTEKAFKDMAKDYLKKMPESEFAKLIKARKK